MADKGLRVQVDTQELGPQDAAEVMLLKDRIGHFVFAEQDIKEEDLVNLPEIKVEKGEKTPSQRLRAVLFVVWEQKKITQSFDDFYRGYVNKVIDKLKENLD